jgi:hypothetical protein
MDEVGCRGAAWAWGIAHLGRGEWLLLDCCAWCRCVLHGRRDGRYLPPFQLRGLLQKGSEASQEPVVLLD